jgi:TPR repeat protein
MLTYWWSAMSNGSLLSLLSALKPEMVLKISEKIKNAQLRPKSVAPAPAEKVASIAAYMPKATEIQEEEEEDNDDDDDGQNTITFDISEDGVTEISDMSDIDSRDSGRQTESINLVDAGRLIPFVESKREVTGFELAQLLEKEPDARRLREAVELYQLAVEKDDLQSMIRMGYFYLTGLFDPNTGLDILQKDPVKGRNLLNRVMEISTADTIVGGKWAWDHVLLSKAKSVLITESDIVFPLPMLSASNGIVSHPDTVMMALLADVNPWSFVDHHNGIDRWLYRRDSHPAIATATGVSSGDCNQYRCIGTGPTKKYFDAALLEAEAGDSRAQFFCGSHLYEDVAADGAHSTPKRMCYWHILGRCNYKTYEQLNAADLDAATLSEQTKLLEKDLHDLKWMKNLAKDLLFKSVRQGNSRARDFLSKHPDL